MPGVECFDSYLQKMDAHRIWKGLNYFNLWLIQIRHIQHNIYVQHSWPSFDLNSKRSEAINAPKGSLIFLIRITSVHSPIVLSIHLPSSFPTTSAPSHSFLFLTLHDKYICVQCSHSSYKRAAIHIARLPTNQLFTCSGTHNKSLIVEYFPSNFIYYIVIL